MADRRATLHGEPWQLAEAADVEGLLDQVLDLLALPGEARARVVGSLEADPCRFEVQAGSEIEAVVRKLDASPDVTRLGVTLTAGLVWVVRLDWRRLIAHEWTHVIRWRLGTPRSSEAEARWVEDAVGRRLKVDFPKGLRVRLTDRGMGLARTLVPRSGVVVGYSRDLEAVRIRWDGKQTIEPWRPGHVRREGR
jgi:hypothetical protein